MGKIFTLFFLVLLLVLGGCSISPPTHRPSYTPQELAMIQACRGWVQSIEANSNAQLNTVPSDQKAFVLMHNETMGMIESVWGKQRDICQPEDHYAIAYQAYTKGQTEIAVTALKEAGATARVISYVYGAVKMSDNFGDRDSSQTTTTTTTTTETTGVIE